MEIYNEKIKVIEKFYETLSKDENKVNFFENLYIFISVEFV